MRALTVRPGEAGSARLEDIAEPAVGDGAVLVQTLAIGICGTDREIVAGTYGAAPPRHDRLVLGHESLGRVLDAPEHGALARGDLVVGIVRRPDPVPCPQCAVGEWDMCSNGQYSEHGIKGLDGFARERFRADPESLVKVHPRLGAAGVLLEPASVVAKAWAQVDSIGNRSRWTPQRALVLGAGPVGLLAALLGVQRGLDVHVFDRVTSGAKPALVQALGASYHTGTLDSACVGADVLLECTGAPQLVFEAMRCVAPNGIACLTGVSSGSRVLSVDMAALNNEMVLENNVVFGTVNANRRHYAEGADALRQADRAWLDHVITRRVPLENWSAAFDPAPDDVKVVLEFQGTVRGSGRSNPHDS
jgi:glucose 1-dehydrogenase